MSKEKKLKLGKRLTKIEQSVSGDYQHIWDCCCDHGLLGFQLLANNKVQHLHFVDVVAPLMKEIQSKLNQHYHGEAVCSVHCLDVAKLPIAQYQSETHLIIIAGVGGELMIDFLSSLLPLCAVSEVEFILSPVHHNCQLRRFLSEQNCHLINEEIIEENNRFYELLHISNKAGSAVSSVGDKMWDFENPRHQVYLQQTLKHYQRMANNPNMDVGNIIKAYQDLIPAV